MSEGQLTIQLTGTAETISVASFLSVIDSAVDLLQDIDAAMSRKRKGTVSWSIAAASMSSPLQVTIAGTSEAEPVMVDEIIRFSMEGLRRLEADGQVAPTYFTDETLEDAKELVSVLNADIARIRFTAPSVEPVTPTQRVAASVDELLPVEREELGTFVGVLETLTVRGKTRFMIWDVITGTRIECLIPRQKLDEAHRAFNKRVAVYGLVRYARTGKPKSIQVRDLRVKRGWDDMVRAADLPVIDITRGVDPTEYVRRLRDEE
jgi:hypothetical protein